MGYIVWTYIPYEGWSKEGFKTVKEAVEYKIKREGESIITSSEIKYDLEVKLLEE